MGTAVGKGLLGVASTIPPERHPCASADAVSPVGSAVVAVGLGWAVGSAVPPFGAEEEAVEESWASAGEAT